MTEGVHLTAAAAERVAEQLRNRGGGLGLRLGVKPSGCSGFAYVLDFVDEVNPDDKVFEEHGVKVAVDESSLPMVNGVTIDFVREGLNQMFRFHNPNAADLCGCGESFSLR